MKLEQMTIFGSDNLEPSIHPKLDWISLVYNDCSTMDVFRVLLGTDYDFDELDRAYSSRFEHCYGYITNLFVSFNHITFGYKQSDIESLVFRCADDSFSFFNSRLPYIRVDISGQGLDYLRSLGIQVDSDFRNRDWLSGSYYGQQLQYHFTRVDFAFDLVNYRYDFLDRQIQICRSCGNPDTLRVGIVGKKGGLAYSIREGDQKTLYLGTGRSDRVLRIYDKLLEFRKAGKLGECPYMIEYSDGLHVPDSWIRIELQCRRPQACEELLFGSDNFLDVFMYIKKGFALRNEENRLDQSWEDLFDWDRCHEIIRNEYFVQYQPIEKRVEDWVEGCAAVNILAYVAYHGWDSFRSHFDKLFLDLQNSKDQITQRRWRALFSKMSGSNLKLPNFVGNFGGFYILK